MTISVPRSVLTWFALPLVVCACSATDAPTRKPLPTAQMQESQTEEAMLVQYLEVVTPEVDATCKALAHLHGVTFGEPIAGFGNARTAALKSGGRIGVRAPMAEHEEPVGE